MDPRGTSSPAAFRVAFSERSSSRRLPVPAILVQIAGLLFFLGLIAVGVIVFIPLAIIAAGVFLITLGVLWVRVKWFQARQPNGPLDGRRNVRVRR